MSLDVIFDLLPQAFGRLQRDFGGSTGDEIHTFKRHHLALLPELVSYEENSEERYGKIGSDER
jgi:hypothetical protein